MPKRNRPRFNDSPLRLLLLEARITPDAFMVNEIDLPVLEPCLQDLLAPSRAKSAPSMLVADWNGAETANIDEVEETPSPPRQNARPVEDEAGIGKSVGSSDWHSPTIQLDAVPDARRGESTTNSRRPLAEMFDISLHRAMPHVQVVHPKVFDGGAVIQRKELSAGQFVRTECNQEGTKASVYNTYHGVSGNAGQNAVAAGKGPALGKAVSAGYDGVDGTVTLIGPNAGSCTTLTIVANANETIQVSDVATNAAGIVVAGWVRHESDQSYSGFIMKLSWALTVAKAWKYSATNGDIQFMGAAISSNGAHPDIFFTGTINDPALTAYDNIFVVRYDPTLSTPLYEIHLDFGTASHGFAIDADRPENAYVGGNFGSTGPIENVTLRVNNDSTIKWAYSIVLDSPSYPNTTNGTFGVKWLGGNSGSSGLYTVGNLQANSLNPPGAQPAYQNTVIAKWTPATGAPLHYSSIWYVPGMDYTGEDGTVDRAGNLYKVGSLGNSSDRDAVLDKFNASGNIKLEGDYVGGVGTQDLGRGVDLVSPSPVGDALIAGSTRTGASGQHPAPLGCDTVHSGGVDGFTMRAIQPFAP